MSCKVHFCLCSKTINLIQTPLPFRTERRLCIAPVLVIVDLPRSQFHVFKLKPNLKTVFFKKQSYHLLISPGFGQCIWYFLLAKRLFYSWSPELEFHSATVLLPGPGLSLCTSGPWAALYHVFYPTLTKQAAKACLQVCKPTLTAPLSTTLTPQSGKKSLGHLRFPGTPGGLPSHARQTLDLPLASPGKRKPNSFF